MKIISWNMAHRREPWRWLLDTDADVALLQEAGEPPPDVADRISADPAPWRTPGADGGRPRGAAVVQLSDRVEVDWIEAQSLVEAGWDGLAASRPGSLSAARVAPAEGEALRCPVPVRALGGPPLVHRQQVDIPPTPRRTVSSATSPVSSGPSASIASSRPGISTLPGTTRRGAPIGPRGEATVFARMEALGLTCVGPQAPHGRQAEPWPDGLPRESKNVPTFHHNRQTPATATIQGDFVFASRWMSSSVRVRALNDPEQWGPRDHCRVEIEVS